MNIRKYLLAIILVLVVFGGARAADDVPNTQKQFVNREMDTIFLPLQNADFSQEGKVDDAGGVAKWRPISRAEGIRLGKGPRGGNSILLGIGRTDNEESYGLYQDMDLKSLRRGPLTLSVSAWVWSDTPGGASLMLSDPEGGRREALSAYHSGASRWEYLTAVYPYEQWPDALRVSLLSGKGAARFAQIKALATYDDRFTKTLPDACNPLRERVTYVKSSRVRIVVVGNSTVNGHAVADKRASFPYVLQLKLESMFPGRFEVINFGLCGWHLPPQIVSLDKAFNSNKACDGASWCGGKEAQFTHKNALAIERNADNNTPTIGELKPDVIIFAGMWNDVWRTLKYAGWGIPPNPDEVNRIGGVPASVEYLRSVIDYIDHPSQENYRLAEKKFKLSMQPLGPEKLMSLQFQDHSSLKRNEQFKRLVENAGIKLAYLTEEFIMRARKYGQVWTMTLPGRFGDAYEDAAAKMRAGGQISPEGFEKFLINGYIDAASERIQNDEIFRVSQKLGVKSVDLSEIYHAENGAMPISEQLSLGYFLANVEDNVHFTYRGNEWIADRMFIGFLDEFTMLSANFEQPLPAKGSMGDPHVR